MLAFSYDEKYKAHLHSTNAPTTHHSDNFWNTAFIYSLFLIPVGLLFGEVPTSIAEIVVVSLWLSTKNWQHKWKLLLHQPYFWILSALYIIHLLGLIYTSDYAYALKDLRIKLPLLIFPVILFSIDYLPSKIIVNLLKWTSIVTCINLLYLWLHAKLNSIDTIDSRHISVFISHIRLGLIAAFALISAVYMIINFSNSLTEKIFFILLSLIIFSLMLSIGLMTGIFTLSVVAIFAVFYMMMKSPHQVYFRILTAITILVLLSLIAYTYHIYQKYFPPPFPSVVYTHTSNGHPYTHQTDAPYTENGHYVFLNISDKELKQEWEKRSQIPFDGKDKNGNELKYTLYRYLASKGLTKDSVGMAQLQLKDIQNIECGYPNYLYADANNFEKRIYQLLQEYQYFKINKQPQGKTLIMRLFYWKLAWTIWMKNFWIGVGTGDVLQAYQAEYIHYPHIPKKQQLRAHQQILTFALTFGIPGLCVILLHIFYPLWYLRTSANYMLYFLFVIIGIISFFIDDTFETQPGVTFYAFLNTLLIKWCTIE